MIIINFILFLNNFIIGFGDDFDVDDSNTTAWGDGWEENDDWAASDVNLSLYCLFLKIIKIIIFFFL